MRIPKQSIKVGIVESLDLVREGIVALLSTNSDFKIVGAWSTADEAISVLDSQLPEVLIVDARLPGHTAFDLLRILPTLSPNTRVLVTVECRERECVVLNPPSRTTHSKPPPQTGHHLPGPDDCLQLALKIGAHGVLRKSCSFRTMSQAIHAVHAGQYWLEMPTATRLAEQYLISIRSSQPALNPLDLHLTLREQQVITLIAQGRSNKEIAHELQLGYSTVKNYVSSILHKLRLEDRTQIALYALQGADDTTQENRMSSKPGSN